VSAGARKLDKGHYLFRENDPSDAMYVIKSGKIAIVKSKGSSEIVLAELGPGQMLGEMAFFDDKPRSASAKAVVEAEVIALPFKALRAQFSGFPEWLKAMVKTVNSHLRSANSRIKNLEKAAVDENEAFPPHRITRLTAILCLVANKVGEMENGNPFIWGHHLRNYTIQIFGEPTNKMDKLLEVLQEMKYVKLEDLSEGRKKIHLLNSQLLWDFTTFYNEWLFKDEAKRIAIEEKEVKLLKALIIFGTKTSPDDKGMVKVSMTQVMNESMKELGYIVKPEETGSLEEKKVLEEKTMAEGGELSIRFNLADVSKLHTYWDIVYTLRKIKA
jgi:CRP/FNR family cyclic AMP-dependent transcriptional regulator